jgi:hypothetical protein
MDCPHRVPHSVCMVHQATANGNVVLSRKEKLALRRAEAREQRALEEEAAALERQADARSRSARERAADAERGAPPQPARSFRLPQTLLPDLLAAWELLQILAPVLQVRSCPLLAQADCALHCHTRWCWKAKQEVLRFAVSLQTPYLPFWRLEAAICPGPVKEGVPAVRGFNEAGDRKAGDEGIGQTQKQANDEAEVGFELFSLVRARQKVHTRQIDPDCSACTDTFVRLMHRLESTGHPSSSA